MGTGGGAGEESSDERAEVSASRVDAVVSRTL